MTTTLAPLPELSTDLPGPVAPRARNVGAPRVTAVLVAHPGGDRLPEVLDAIGTQTRPPERLIVVAVDDQRVANAETPPEGSVRDRLGAHQALASAISDIVVLEADGPLDTGRAVCLALAELDRGDAGGRAEESPLKAEPVLSDEEEDHAAAPEEGSAEAATSSNDSNTASGIRQQHGSNGGPSNTEWLWLLDDMSAPEPDALRRLVEAVRRSRSVGIAGPKVVRWDDPRCLVELGRQVTRTGRRIDAPADGEADQGQYDTRTDVLAVGTAGMLLRRDAYDTVGGFDAAFAGGGADLDLGWRAQLAGHRVVVVPTAVVRKAPSSSGKDAGPLARHRAARTAARRVAITRCSPWVVPFLAVWIVLSSVVSATGLLVLKRPQHAWAELGDIAALFSPLRSLGARWRFRKARSVRRRHLTGLFVGTGAAVGHTWDRVQEALTPDRSGRPEITPGADTEAAEPGPVAEEAEALTGLPPSLPQRIVTHPGFLAVLICAGLSALTFRTALIDGLLDARGPGLVGGELRAVATDASGLWHQFRDAWHGAGFGNALDVSPAVGVLAALTWLVERLPYVSDGRTPAGVTLSWLLLAAMPLSALTAYLGARVVTRSRWGRGLVALAWGTSGVLAASLTSGRVSVVVAHILLPLVLAGVGSTLKRDGTWTATFAAALAAGVVGAFVPILLAIVGFAAVVAVLVGPGIRRRLRALVLAVVPVALLGPWVLRFVEQPRLLLTGPGLLDVSPQSTPTWQLAMAQPEGGRDLVSLLFLPVLVAAVVALARQSAGRGRSVALSALAVTAVLGLGLGLGSERVAVGQAVADDGQLGLATLWAGIGLEIYVAAVLGIVLAGWRGLAHLLGERRFGWPRIVAGVVCAAVAGAIVAGAALSAWDGIPQLKLAVEAVPAVAAEQAAGPDANRLVVLTPLSDRLDYALVGDEPGQLMRDVERATHVSDPGLAPVLSTLASGGQLPGGAGEQLADLGVGFVSLHAAADSPLARTLDASAGLTRLGSSTDQTLWRVVARPSSGAADVPVPPARVRIDNADGSPVQALPVDGPHGAVSTHLSDGAAGRRVVFAEAPEWASHAVVTYDGAALTPVATGGTPTYVLPSTAGRLEADLPPSHPRWFLAQLALLAAVVFLAVPFGTRRSRRLT